MSVFVFNTKGEWLLQRRATNKYHSNGLWTNACCTHPYPGETSMVAAYRRLKEEMGMECDLTEIFSFIYSEKLDNELIEHEYDHVFIGITDQLPSVNPQEVMDWKYITFNNLQTDIKQNPQHYTVWFRQIMDRVNSVLINSL